MSSLNGTLPGGGNGGLRAKAGGGGSMPRPAKITMFLTPSWKPGVLSPSISTGRVGPTPSRRTPGQT